MRHYHVVIDRDHTVVKGAKLVRRRGALCLDIAGAERETGIEQGAGSTAHYVVCDGACLGESLRKPA